MYGLNKGTRIAHFSLEQQLGQGGQGSVWKAFALDGSGQPTGGPVALKIIPVRGTPTTMVERVRREAEALSRLSHGHPSVVTCHGVHEDPSLGVLAVAMELVEGVDLQDTLRDPRCDGPAREAILLHVAQALGYLHDNGIVHRDIKPANILVKHSFFQNPSDPSGVKLVDFGIATPKGNPKPLTEVGTVIGTPAYMPPERIDPMFWQVAKGLPCEDVFSLGVVAYETLFGCHPTGVEDDSALSTYAERYRAISRSGEPWPSVPPNHRWSDALRGALALKVEDRLPDGNAVARAITSGVTPAAQRQPQRTELGAPIPMMGSTGGFAPPGATQVGQIAPFFSEPAAAWSPPLAQPPGWSPVPVMTPAPVAAQAMVPTPAMIPSPGIPPAPAYTPRSSGGSSGGGNSTIKLLMGAIAIFAIGIPTLVLAARFVGRDRDDDHGPIVVPTNPPEATTPVAPPPTDTLPPTIPTPTFTPEPPPTTTAPPPPTNTGTKPPTTQPTGTSTGNGPPPKIGPGTQPTTQPTGQPTVVPGTTTAPPPGGRPIRIGSGSTQPGTQPTGQPTTQPTSKPPGGRPPGIRINK
ncbi:MAG: protein kinase [Myxococcales bacterium]|nr:protein kinase [Polyangiaceae bacterium]MDW8248188.1 protein kinase [Myxococcales bacterium]